MNEWINQVSTPTGTISREVQLHVVRTEAFIQGGEEYHVDLGSTISLTCIIGKQFFQAIVIILLIFLRQFKKLLSRKRAIRYHFKVWLDPTFSSVRVLTSNKNTEKKHLLNKIMKIMKQIGFVCFMFHVYKNLL